MKRKPEKHTPYFDLLDALGAAKSCPFCELEERDDRRYLKDLLYEKVNDRSVRADLVRSRGFCHRHSHLLLDQSDPLGVAILSHDQLTLALDSLNALADKPSPKPRRQSHAICPACSAQLQSRSARAKTLLDWLHDPDLRKAFDAAPALCLPHLSSLLDDVSDPDARKLILSSHKEKYSALASELASLISRGDYRRRKDPPGPESDSWRRAASTLTGAKDVF